MKKKKIFNMNMVFIHNSVNGVVRILFVEGEKGTRLSSKQ